MLRSKSLSSEKSSYNRHKQLAQSKNRLSSLSAEFRVPRGMGLMGLIGPIGLIKAV